MCTAQSAFFYGVFVETAYLCFAADAYKKSKGSLLAVDLICARRRKGQLSVASAQLKTMPEEVWKLVKLQIIDDAIAQAEQSEVSDLLRDWEDDGDFENDHLSSTWEDVGRYNLNRFYGDGGVTEMLDSRLEEINGLLEAFGLALPFTKPYSKAKSRSYDIHALSAISLPLHSTASSPNLHSYPSLLSKASAKRGSNDETISFSSQTFDLPPNASRRIHSFLSFFRLQAKNPESETIYRPQPLKNAKTGQESSGAKEDYSKTSETHESRCCDEFKTQPHWQIPPYDVAALEGGATGGVPLSRIDPEAQAGSLTWIVDVPAGSNVTLAVRDSTGATGFSAPIPVITGTSTDCLKATSSDAPVSATVSATTTDDTATAPSSASFDPNSISSLIDSLTAFTAPIPTTTTTLPSSPATDDVNENSDVATTVAMQPTHGAPRDQSVSPAAAPTNNQAQECSFQSFAR